jgi:hypothetical protein
VHIALIIGTCFIRNETDGPLDRPLSGLVCSCGQLALSRFAASIIIPLPVGRPNL